MSYRWRSTDPLRAIHLDGMRLFVRNNIVDLLKCLRDPQKSRMFWIDAICIDQSDVQERNSQVEKMGLIYERAETVVSWLDLQDGHMLRKTSELLSAPNCWKYTDFRKGREDCHELWDALEQVLRHDYWTRTWIIQEIITAQRVILQSRCFAMPMSLLEEFAYWVMIRKDSSKAIHADWEVIASANCIQLCEHRMAASTQSSSRQPLTHLLMRYSNFECTDPRDKVFSLLNMSIELDTPITVNYAFTCAELFVEVLRCLSRSGQLGVKEVVGTAALLYKQLLCDYPSEIERRNAVYAVGSTLEFDIEPYPRGHITSVSFREEPVQLSQLRNQAAGMREMPSHRSEYHGDLPQWVDFPDVQRAPFVQPNDLESFTVHFHPGESTKAHAAEFGLADCNVNEGDKVYQFSNTNFAVVTRRELQNHLQDTKQREERIVGPALLAGPIGATEWNPFVKSTDMSSWFKSFELTHADAAGYNNVRASATTMVQLMKLLSLVCRPWSKVS